MIDNLDGQGARDYTPFLDAGKSPQLVRKLNRPSELHFSLVTGDGNFVVPVVKARVTLGRSNGSDVFAGYLAESPRYQYLGWTAQGPLYRYELVALSDEMVLDEKSPPPPSPFVGRSAGDALRQLSTLGLPGWLEMSGVEEGDVIPFYRVNAAKKWSESAAEIARLARCKYRSANGQLIFGPLGDPKYALEEGSPEFSPGDLDLIATERVVNDLTVIGQLEPGARVKDYFVGDGFTTKFYLSQVPFTRSSRTILDEEYVLLDPTHWVVTDPQAAISVSAGKLQVAGGTGVDGQTHLDFIEKIELGGAMVLQHGDVVFNAVSDGVIGGLYAGTVSVPGCLAGFRITPAGAPSRIQALIAGATTGSAIMTQPGHRYVFTTRFFATEVYRMQQVFHSATHSAGAALGGETVAGDVRVVLEVHEIDPGNPASQVAPATVLYDGMIAAAPAFCTYSLINASSMQCSVAFTRVVLGVDAVVRSTLPQQSTQTRRAGSLLEGADCRVSEEPALQFYPQYAPAVNELIEVHYRGRGRARARVKDPASIAAHQRGNDDGVHGSVRQIMMPAPRTSTDCETAAVALLESAGRGWVGTYRLWSPFLPGAAEDIYPGDGIMIDVPSRAALFAAIIKEAEIEVADMEGENSRYTLHFVDEGDPSLDFDFETAIAPTAVLNGTDVNEVGNVFLPDLTAAGVTNVTATTVTVDTGFSPAAGEGIEVRRTDAGWGADNDRNLIGRFSSRIFTVARYGHVQDCFLRRYDSSSPAKYSRYSAALHVDFPL